MPLVLGKVSCQTDQYSLKKVSNWDMRFSSIIHLRWHFLTAVLEHLNSALIFRKIPQVSKKPAKVNGALKESIT